jgi:hypothetical protein
MHVGTSKWVIPCDANFGAEVLGRLQKDLSDAENESKSGRAITESDCNSNSETEE